MEFIMHLLVFVILLTGVRSEYCPIHCQCNYEKDYFCSINDSNVTLELIDLGSRMATLMITCEGTNFNCTDLPRLGAPGVRKFRSISCPPSILRCVNDILEDQTIDTVNVFNWTAPLDDEDMTSLEDETSLELPLTVLDKLEVLQLKNMSIKSIAAGTFSLTPRLQSLNLEDNPLESLPNEFLGTLESFKFITITCLPTEKQPELSLGSHAFANLPILKDVRIGSCIIESLPENLFTNSSNLLYVNIGDNIIKNISPKIFSNLSSMIAINLDNNTLKDLPNGLFADVTWLEMLSLSHIGIITLQDTIFSNLTSLLTLDLSNNNIRQLPEGIFADLITLVTLDLAHNQIKMLPSNIFDNLTILATLNLSYNNYTNLPEDIFASLTELDTLNLANNKIYKLPKRIFASFEALKILNLNNNRLEALPSAIFNNLSLLSLHLANNHIVKLDNRLFKLWVSLRTLSLNDNNIEEIPSKFFTVLTSLKSVNFANNKIRELPDVGNLTTVNVDFNNQRL